MWGIPIEEPKTAQEVLDRVRAVKASLRRAERAAAYELARPERERRAAERARIEEERALAEEAKRRLSLDLHEAALRPMEADYQRFCALRELGGNEQSKGVSLRAVVSECSRITEVSVHDIVGPWRSQTAVRARQLAFWVLRNSTRLSLPQIGRYLGKRDHTTVLHGIRRVDHMLGLEAVRIKPMKYVEQTAAVWEIIAPNKKHERDNANA